MSLIGNHVETVVLLLEVEADVEAQTLEGRTPLLAAAEGNFRQVAELLLEAGADVNVQDATGNTCCHLAAKGGHTRFIQFLATKEALMSLQVRRVTGAFSFFPFFLFL